jgi:hypothetical protein
MIAPRPGNTPACDRALAARDWSAALAAATVVNDAIEAQHVETLYTLARCHALLGHADDAVAYLERVHQAELFDVSRVRNDEAFAALRANERFTAITQAIWLKGGFGMPHTRAMEAGSSSFD